MTRWIYSLLVYSLLPVALLKLLWQGRKNKAYWGGWDERFGFVKAAPDAPIIWIHAVSVGETIAIRPLVEALLKKYPDHKIWFTNGTINGRARAEALYGDRVIHSYAPYDTPCITARFLKRVKPKLVLIMETEVWINWMHALKQKNVPVMLVNARLSERSYRGYAKFQVFFKEAWKSFLVIASQGKPDADRYILLGADPARVHVVGNLKYNLVVPVYLKSEADLWRQKIPAKHIWIAASTHAGEEEKLLGVFKTLKQDFPELLWILVPRHPERIESVKKLCEDASWSVKLRSQCGKQPEAEIQEDILLVDTLGELLLFYAIAQVAFVGGSFIEQGGHNILEPAAVGTAVTCGPWMFNFATILEQFLAAQAVLQCNTLEDLAQKTRGLLQDASQREALVLKAKACFEHDQASLPKHMALIEEIQHYDET